MIKLIRAACQWGQKNFDGWVIGKARYCVHSRSEPVSYESTPKKTAPGYVLLETTAYDAGRLPCQSLEICLVDLKVPGNPGRGSGTGAMPHGRTMTFPRYGLGRFLSASGDTNPIHHGPNAVIPGLWILSRLEELYGSHCPGETLSIRFLCPVHADGSVRLIRENSIVTGTMGSTTCFTMTIHTPDQTQNGGNHESETKHRGTH